MLTLHRITRFNEFLKCRASGEILMYGDFYYTNDNGDVISANYKRRGFAAFKISTRPS